MKELFTIVALIGASTVFAQTGELKTYSGKYRFGDRDATATYTYKETPEGERIFDGNFRLETKGYFKTVFSGKFVNNKQDGTWKCIRNGDVPIKWTITFKDGVMDGPLSFTEYYKKEIYSQMKASAKNGYLDGDLSYNCRGIRYNLTFCDGYLNGPFEYVKKNYDSEYIVKGIFDYGQPTGRWTSTEIYCSDKYITEYVINENAEHVPVTIDIKTIENSTGDVTTETHKFSLDYLPDLEHLIDFKIRIPNSYIREPEIAYGYFDFEKKFILQYFDQLFLHDSEKLKIKEKLRTKESESAVEGDDDGVYIIPIDDNDIFDTTEQSPEFPGGLVGLLQYIVEHLKYPEKAAKEGIQGRVTVKFVVTRTGSIGKVRVIRSEDPDLDKEAVRVIKSLPRFTPGKMNGQTVNCWYTLPITFKLQGK